MTQCITLDASLWHDCDAIYRHHQQACLRLQDDHQVNVNLLLLALWLDRQTYFLSATQWRALQQHTLEWDSQILTPYRKLRRLSKSSLADAQYQQMLTVELMLERQSQTHILQHLKRLTWQGSDSNLTSYLALFDLKAEQYTFLSSAPNAEPLKR
ncbi:TIGR02444 family protein [Shewanella youngdeokensis]|uniref:TIGR02444 family protein n=1 Tax=Shewanella youngdeokensis TaxID=2999068 RepID=A0ABZ0JXR3_9GAMM|nr:TIGR02444 family protein [Shewanella sp. DAU334]